MLVCVLAYALWKTLNHLSKQAGLETEIRKHIVLKGNAKDGEPVIVQVEGEKAPSALDIDVRTEGEYASGHLAGTTNVPLARLAGEIEKLAPDHQTPIALHCLSGGRSASAMAALKRMGYTRVYNLGSYGRAEKLLKEHGPK